MNLTTANQLTILRMLLIPAFVILLVYGYRGWALVTFMVAGLTDLLDGLIAHIPDFGVGSIAEIFDAEPPYTPRGCVAQAWSVAEVLRCWVKTA